MTTQLKTRYLVIRLDVNNQIGQTNSNTSFTNGTTTKFIYAYSGSSLTEGVGYQRVDCIITQGIGWQDNVATIDIYGMNISDINTFTRANLTTFTDVYSNNLVTVYAGYQLNSDGLPPLVYSGYVIFAGPDFNVSRDRKFTLHAMQFYDNDNTNIIPYNVKGAISLDNLFRFLCQRGNYIYRGSNIKGTAYNPILTGSIRQQLQQACSKYGYHMYMSRTAGEVQNILYIAPINQPLQDNVPIVLSAQNNEMIGFPIVEQFGFNIKCYFNPSLIVGLNIRVNSLTVEYINDKTLYINQMIHELHNREEPWQSTLQLNTWSGTPT